MIQNADLHCFCRIQPAGRCAYSVNYARKNGVSITKDLATDMAIEFLQRVKDAGYVPVIYTNRDYLRNYFDMERITAALGTVYVWYARYTSSLPAESQKSV